MTEYFTPKMQDVKFVYFRRNGGVISVCYHLVSHGGKGGVHKIAFAWSGCSPLDSFSKRKGRAIAFGRLTKKLERMRTLMMLDDFSDLSIQDNPSVGLYKQIVGAIEKDLFREEEKTLTTVDLPHWSTHEFKNAAGIIDAVKNGPQLGVAEANFLKRLIESRTVA